MKCHALLLFVLVKVTIKGFSSLQFEAETAHVATKLILDFAYCKFDKKHIENILSKKILNNLEKWILQK